MKVNNCNSVRRAARCAARGVLMNEDTLLTNMARGECPAVATVYGVFLRRSSRASSAVTTSLSFSNTRRYVRVTGPLRQKPSEPVSNVRRSCWEAGRVCAHAHERASYDFLNFRHAPSPTISRCTLIVSVSGSAAMSKVIPTKPFRGDISQGARRDVSIARIVKILPSLIRIITATVRISADDASDWSSRILMSDRDKERWDRAFFHV